MTFKITNVISAFNRESGGPPRALILMAAAGEGHWDSALLTTSHQESATDGLLVDEFAGQIDRLPSRLHGMRGGLSVLAGFDRSALSALCNGGIPDLVHIHGMWSPFLAAFAREARRLAIPYILAPHGMLEPWSLSVRSARKAIALKSYQGKAIDEASALHATSEPEAENLRRLTEERIPVFVIPNAIEPPRIGHLRADAPSGRERTLLFLSRLHEKKGLDILLNAWNELRPDKWRLLIVGSGKENYVARLRQFCTSNHLPNVEFRSHVEGDERETVFREASAFVLPTHSENFGNVIGEALIRGIPVITTTGTPWSAIVDQRCGWYIEPTLLEVKRAIAETVATEGQTLRQMGERGRHYVTDNFSLAVVRDALQRMYQATLRAHRDPGQSDGEDVARRRRVVAR